MNLSDRLKCISRFLPKCECLADIGTDHGYIPIDVVKSGKCTHAIASDINKGPIMIAKKNIKLYGLEDKIDTRVGPGLATLKKGEADVILIAGMGGNMIADIIDENKDIASEAVLVLQPVQYPEELRKYLYEHEFDILDEELSRDENKFYHIIKAVKCKNFKKEDHKEYESDVFFYTGIELFKKKHPLLIDYVDFKIERFSYIIKELTNSENLERKNQVIALKKQFEEVKACLEAARK